MASKKADAKSTGSKRKSAEEQAGSKDESKKEKTGGRAAPLSAKSRLGRAAASPARGGASEEKATRRRTAAAAGQGAKPERRRSSASSEGRVAPRSERSTRNERRAHDEPTKRAPSRVRKRGAVAQPKPPADPPSKRLALAVAEAALEKKAVNVQIIDVVGKVDYADYLVVMSGRSDRQVAALARGIEEGVEKATGERCASIEGAAEGAWVLMDFGDVVVHIFHDDVRGYYDLESLWIDAGRVHVPAAGA